MPEELRSHIAECFPLSVWVAETEPFLQEGRLQQIFRLEKDIDYNDSRLHCVVISKVFYDTAGSLNIDYIHDIFAHAW